MRLASVVLLAALFTAGPALGQTSADPQQPETPSSAAPEAPSASEPSVDPPPPEEPAGKPVAPAPRPAKGWRANIMDRLYVHINVGAQPSSPDVTVRGGVPLYDEVATFETRGEAGGGVLVDLGGGYRVWRRMYAAVSYSRVSGDLGGPLTGQVPHPLIFDSPRPISGSVSGLDRVEHAVHLQAIWRHPISNRIDIGVALGPTIFNVSQDLVSGLQVTEGGSSVTLAGTTTESVSDSAVGFNIGVDGSYSLTRRLAVGAFVRYAGGSVDLPGSAGVVSLDAGGVQVGAGVRLRFR